MTARVPGLGPADFDAVVGEASKLYPYGLAGGAALTMGLASGAILASTSRWDGQLTACTVIAAGLVAATAAGVAQARRMTRLRQDALRAPRSRDGHRHLTPCSVCRGAGKDVGPWNERPEEA